MTPKVALISGTSVVRSRVFASWKLHPVATAHGTVAVRRHGGHVLLNRHGEGFPLPPHAINHRANIRALADLGFTNVLSLNSVGSLREDIPPGSLVSCSDYVCLQQGPATFQDTELRGGTPGIPNPLIPALVAALAPEFRVLTGKVYVQMRGPRFETRAEIRILKEWGDVVGMTAAHEADLCAEIGLAYNSLAMVDNYANGVAGSAIDFAAFDGLVMDNQERVDTLLERILKILG